MSKCDIQESCHNATDQGDYSASILNRDSRALYNPVPPSLKAALTHQSSYSIIPLFLIHMLNHFSRAPLAKHTAR